MRAFRLVKARHADSALEGEGARLAGGRWNPPGLALAYCSSSLALAVLELLAHTDPSDFPDDLVAVTVEIPEALPVERWPPETLPGNWRQEAGKGALHGLGASWLRSRRSAVLRVPSVIVPAEWNLLINPAHPDAARIQVLAREPFALDPRL